MRGKALDSLPPQREGQHKKPRKPEAREGTKPAELTTLRVNFSKEVLRPCSLSGFRKNKQRKKKVGRKIQKEKKKSSAYTWFPNSTAATNGQKAKQGAETGREKQPALNAGVSGADRKQKPWKMLL